MTLLLAICAICASGADDGFGRREGFHAELKDAAFQCESARVLPKLQAIQRELAGVPQEDTRVGIRREIAKLARCPGGKDKYKPEIAAAAAAYFRHYRKAVAYKVRVDIAQPSPALHARTHAKLSSPAADPPPPPGARINREQQSRRCNSST
jgi:hypothetical protein